MYNFFRPREDGGKENEILYYIIAIFLLELHFPFIFLVVGNRLRLPRCSTRSG